MITRLRCDELIMPVQISRRSKAICNSLWPNSPESRLARKAGAQHTRDHIHNGDTDDIGGTVVHRLLALLPVVRVGPIIVEIMIAVVSSPLSANEHRSREVNREFQREHPCPSTGQTRRLSWVLER